MEDQKPEIPQSSPGRIILTVVALFFLGSAVGGGTIQLMCDWQGIPIADALKDFGPESTAPERNFVKGLLILNHLSSFLLPCLIAGLLFYKRQWPERLELRLFPGIRTFWLALLILLCAFPVAQGLFELNRWILGHFAFSEQLLELEGASENLQIGLLKMDSIWELITSIIAMALVPAIGEELLFRGFLQTQLIRAMKNPVTGILIAALFFSLIHFQAQRFLAIFWLGTVLGLLYFWTKNLWVPIFAHFLNNGVQVVVAWFYQEDLQALNQQSDSFPWWVAVAGLVLFPFFAKLLIAHSDKKQNA